MDDTTAVEVIPRTSISILDLVVRGIHQYCINHNMKLNPKKCKDVIINFTQNPNTVIRPICFGNQQVEQNFLSLYILDLKNTPFLTRSLENDYMIGFVVRTRKF